MSISCPFLAAKSKPADVEKAIRHHEWMMAFVKIDGVRATNIEGRMHSRTMKSFPNKFLNSVFNRQHLAGMDGEMCATEANAHDCCRVTSGAVADIEGVYPFKWYVFDRHDMPDAPYLERYNSITEIGSPVSVQKLKYHVVKTWDDILALEERAVGQNGFEGLILRDPLGLYKENRGTVRESAMLKLKRFTDAEATVIGFVERMHNDNEAKINELGRTARSSAAAGKRPADTLGVLECRDIETGQEFTMDGFSADLRDEIWANRDKYLGRIVKYKHFPVGRKDKPRHPSFLSFRNAFDM